MWGFGALKVLDLGNNGLVELPDSFTSMVSLECLNLQGNSFPKLPQVKHLPMQLLLQCSNCHGLLCHVAFVLGVKDAQAIVINRSCRPSGTLRLNA